MPLEPWNSEQIWVCDSCYRLMAWHDIPFYTCPEWENGECYICGDITNVQKIMARTNSWKSLQKEVRVKKDGSTDTS